MKYLFEVICYKQITEGNLLYGNYVQDNSKQMTKTNNGLYF